MTNNAKKTATWWVDVNQRQISDWYLSIWNYADPFEDFKNQDKSQ